MTDEPFRITKIDDDQMLVFGYASVAAKSGGETVVDHQGDMIEPRALEAAAYDYVLRSRDGGLMHQRRGVARLVESFVITPEKLASMGLSGGPGDAVWHVGFKVDDPEVWKRVKAGELKAFSIGGRAVRREVA